MCRNGKLYSGVLIWNSLPCHNRVVVFETIKNNKNNTSTATVKTILRPYPAYIRDSASIGTTDVDRSSPGQYYADDRQSTFLILETRITTLVQEIGTCAVSFRTRFSHTINLYELQGFRTHNHVI